VKADKDAATREVQINLILEGFRRKIIHGFDVIF
jgi:hypothetical protein